MIEEYCQNHEATNQLWQRGMNPSLGAENYDLGIKGMYGLAA